MDRTRVYTALVFLPCFYVMVRYLPAVVFFTVTAIVLLLAQYEYYRLYFSEHVTAGIGLGLGLGLLVSVAFAAPQFFSSQGVVSLIIASALLYQVLNGRDVKAGLPDSAILAFGVFYTVWLPGHMILIRELNEGISLIFFLFIVTWANDTAAYYVGTVFGKHQMTPVISPLKTWEGAAGGLLGSVLIALACRAWFLPSLTALDALGLGLLFGIVGPLGDLGESILKRSAGVKHSGRLIPGHGGMLDRLDSLIFTTPTFYYYLLATRTV